MDRTGNNQSDLTQIQKLTYYLFSHIKTPAVCVCVCDLYRYDICVYIEVRKLVKGCAGRIMRKGS